MDDIKTTDTAQELPIIEFDHVSKVYTLYRNDKERFFSLFHKSKNLKTNLAFNDVSFKVNRGESIGIIGSIAWKIAGFMFRVALPRNTPMMQSS